MAVVVVSDHDVAALRACLGGCAARCGQAGAEVIVVRAGGDAELADVAREFPAVTYLLAAPGTRSADLRRIGLLQCSRNLVVFIDDRDSERHAWAERLCSGMGDAGVLQARPEIPLRDGAGSGAAAAATNPVLSVVIPVHNGGATLLLVVEALALSELPRERWELVVVDDASTDDTAAIAAQHADRLVRLPAPRHGPGYARNRGFEVTLGECITFLNADVMPRPDTLGVALDCLVRESDVGGVFGAYDTKPLAQGLVSQYRNLLQHYYHQRHAGDTSTFSSACGTIRSRVFEQAGGYDEWHFGRHQLEDLDLGQRIRQLGHRIVLDPAIHATHLKRWTLRRLIATEIFDRGVPWMRLARRQLIREKDSGRSLRRIKSYNIALTWLAVALAAIALRELRPEPLLGAGVCLGLVVVNNTAQLAFFCRERGLLFAAATIPLDVLYYLVCGVGVVFGWIVQQAVGEPRPGPTAEAFTEMSIARWPPVPARRAVESRRGYTDTNLAEEHLRTTQQRNGEGKLNDANY